jgi:hypothetical protein
MVFLEACRQPAGRLIISAARASKQVRLTAIAIVFYSQTIRMAGK